MPLAFTLAAALCGAGICELLKIPAGALIGAMLGVMLLNVAALPVAEVSRPLRFAVFVVVGWIIGETMTRDVLRSLLSNGWLIIATVVALLTFGGLVAVLLVRLGLLDPATAFLATSPGGLSQMAALSTAVGADASVVATLHVVRVVSVVLVAPIVLKFLPLSSA